MTRARDLENRTARAMIGLYCRHVHGGNLCDACAALVSYVERRVAQCPHGDAKPACSRCATPCYRPDMRERIRAVMRYAGPRMPYRHPLLALRHWLGRRGRPTLPGCFPDRG